MAAQGEALRPLKSDSQAVTRSQGDHGLELHLGLNTPAGGFYRSTGRDLVICVPPVPN